MAKYFSHWLPEKQQKMMSSSGGFSFQVNRDYLLLLNDFYFVQVTPGLLVLSVNSNFCNNLNLWLLLHPSDPAQHLQWIVTELLRAEKSGSKVFIISHIPPGSTSCLSAWSHQYTRIITRFIMIISNIIIILSSGSVTSSAVSSMVTLTMMSSLSSTTSLTSLNQSVLGSQLPVSLHTMVSIQDTGDPATV